MTIVKRILLPLLLLAPALAPAIASAQNTDAARPDTAALPLDEPDISITASVTARELTFQKVPEGELRLIGADTLHIVRRTNIPDILIPDITFRDIGVRLVIAANVEKLVARVLLETTPEEEEKPSGGDGR